LTRDHDGSVLDDPSTALTGNAGDGAGIVRHVLGDRQAMAQDGIAQISGLGVSQVGSLLTLLAPLVMGAIGRQQRSQGLDANGLAGMLTNAHATATAAQPDLLGMASRLFDRDGDGSPLNDV